MASPGGWNLQMAPREGRSLCSVKTATRRPSEGAVSGGWGAWEDSTEVPGEAGDSERQQATLGAANEQGGPDRELGPADGGRDGAGPGEYVDWTLRPSPLPEEPGCRTRLSRRSRTRGTAGSRA
ncbi:hypothetical protein H8959_005357 [Pygathrix nigripes]